jgi:hypothetical protein
MFVSVDSPVDSLEPAAVPCEGTTQETPDYVLRSAAPGRKIGPVELFSGPSSPPAALTVEDGACVGGARGNEAAGGGGSLHNEEVRDVTSERYDQRK